VPSTNDELAARLARMERDLQRLSGALRRRAASDDEPALRRISFSAWLKLSAPTFGALALGFTLLWNAQQATNAQLFELTRSVGRLEGSIASLDAGIDRLRDAVERLSERVARLES